MTDETNTDLYQLETLSAIHNELRIRRKSPDSYKIAIQDLEMHIAILIQKVIHNG